MQPSRPVPASLFCLLLVAAAPALAVPDADGGFSEPGAAAAGIAEDALLSARLHYNVGFEQFEKATQLEMAASSLKGGAQRRKQQEALTEFSGARERFRAAAVANPAMKEAWNMVGYTSRRLGDYEDSLAAYDRALALNPDYPEAIEYRAELFMLTGRFDDVKAAHATLLQSSPSYAKELETAMKAWVARKDAPGADAPGRAGFAAWVATL